MGTWRLVPCEPTPEMLAAANKASLSTAVLLDDTRFACERATYRAMLSAAPSVGDDVVERAAKAQYQKFMEDVADLEPAWDDLPESHRDRMRTSLKAALAVLTGE